jgi:hypothetical protein
MPTVPIETPRGVEHVELDDLSPTAAAIARIWSANDLHTPCSLHLESVRTIREMGIDPETAAVWHTPDALDRPHRTIWANRMVWPRRRPDARPWTLASLLEEHAAALPLGYRPIAPAHLDLDLDDDALVDDTDYITREQVLDLLRTLGRPISKATLYNYTKNPPAGWPGIAHYVGRTPRWSRTAIEGYARSR